MENRICSGNILYHKKWIVCGDSFTAGVSGNVFEEGPFKGENKIYPYYNADRALKVIDAIGSNNLRIIFDPVNLLYPGNIDKKDEVFADTIEKLADRIAVVHLKDYVPEGNDLKSIAAGTGEMDYTRILKFMKERKPYIQATLENTVNDNAVTSRKYLEELYNNL